MGHHHGRNGSVKHRRRGPGADADRFGDHVWRHGDCMHRLSVHTTRPSRVDGRGHSGFGPCRERARSAGATDPDVDNVHRTSGCGNRGARNVASQRLDHPRQRADRGSHLGACARRCRTGIARDDSRVVFHIGSGARGRRRDGGGRARTHWPEDRRL